MLPNPSLKDRVILVTGAGGGIGKVAAKAFAERGATVILLGKTPSRLEAVFDEIETAGYPTPYIMPLDLKGARIEDYQTLAEAIHTQFGKLDGILHNAGWFGSLTPLSHYPLQQWFDVLQVNLTAPFLMTQTLLPLLNNSDNASVLFTVDPLVHSPHAYWGAYTVAKAGLTALMHTWAEELEVNTVIRMNAIAPPISDTRFRHTAFPAENREKLAQPVSFMHHYVYWMSPASGRQTGQWIGCQEKEKDHDH